MNSEYYKNSVARNAKAFLTFDADTENEDISQGYLLVFEDTESLSRNAPSIEIAKQLRELFESLRTDNLREEFFGESINQTFRNRALFHLQDRIRNAAEFVKSI